MSLLLFPKARFRFYGSPGNYLRAFGDTVLGKLDNGQSVQVLERRIAQEVGGHGLATCQGRVAIYLAVKALIKPGQKVILSPYTIYDVVNMVLCAGGVPLFADIDGETCNISSARVAELLEDADVGAVLVTHLHGLACDIEEIASLCRQRGVALIEDAAQAYGASFNGKRLGGFGDVGIFSFGRVKNVNGFFGGMAVARDARTHARMAAEMNGWPTEARGRLIKRVASCLAVEVAMSAPVFQALTFWLLRIGCLHDVQAVNKLVQTESQPVLRSELPQHYRRRMTAMQARIILAQLDRVDASSSARIAAADVYHDGLKNIPGLELPPRRTDGSHIYLAYPIQVDDRWALVKHLMRRRRDVAVQHIGNVEDLPIFASYATQCVNARRTAERVILLPTYPGYGRAQIDATIKAIRDFYVAPS